VTDSTVLGLDSDAHQRRRMLAPLLQKLRCQLPDLSVPVPSVNAETKSVDDVPPKASGPRWQGSAGDGQ
jgi:hypothetical protein